MKRLLYVLFVVCLLAACGEKKENAEDGGQACLAASRAAFAQNNLKKAKAAIDTLRTKYPQALNAREEGIILLDSIELAESKEELNALQVEISKANLDKIGKVTMDFKLDEAKEKVRFFERKIQHDLQHKQKH